MGPRISRTRQQFWEKGSWFLLCGIAPAYFAMIVEHFVANRAVVISCLLIHLISRKSNFSVSYRENHSQRKKILEHQGNREERVFTYGNTVLLGRCRRNRITKQRHGQMNVLQLS
jgi:hypothetical protein